MRHGRARFPLVRGQFSKQIDSLLLETRSHSASPSSPPPSSGRLSTPVANHRELGRVRRVLTNGIRRSATTEAAQGRRNRPPTTAATIDCPSSTRRIARQVRERGWQCVSLRSSCPQNSPGCLPIALLYVSDVRFLLLRRARRRACQHCSVVRAEISVLPRIFSHMFPDPSTISPTLRQWPSERVPRNHRRAPSNSVPAGSLRPSVIAKSVLANIRLSALVSQVSTPQAPQALPARFSVRSSCGRRSFISPASSGRPRCVHPVLTNYLANVSAEVPSSARGQVPRALDHQRRLRPGRGHAYDRVSPHSATIVCAASRTHTSWHRRRVALVDYRGQTVFCTYVLPTNPVTDYRTNTTGIQAADLTPGMSDRPCFHYQSFTLRPVPSRQRNALEGGPAARGAAHYGQDHRRPHALARFVRLALLSVLL